MERISVWGRATAVHIQSSPQPGYGEWDAESGSDTTERDAWDINSSQLITFSRDLNYARQELDSEDYMIASGCYTPTNATSYSAIRGALY